MATKKKSVTRKKLTKKAQGILRSNIFISLALTSILFNLFFFVGIVLFNSTNNLDESLYTAAVGNLCDENYAENLEERMEDSVNPEYEKAIFEVKCQTGEFASLAASRALLSASTTP